MNTKEFFTKWKEGIMKVTELQKIRQQIISTWIMIIGIICGIVIACFNFRGFWWLIIILIAALFNTVVGQLTLYQKKNWLEKIEKSIQEV